jgi:NADH dehydrogenase
MILLLGATGLLGAQVLSRLVENRWPVRVLSRGNVDWQSDYTERLKSQGVQVHYADFDDLSKLEEAFRDCTAVVNTVGSISTKNNASLRTANLGIVETVVEMVSKCNVQRLIHLSCLGANQNAKSEYLKLKWQAEAKIKECQAHWTILKPSYMFGEKFALLELVEPLVRFRLCLPIFGSGLNLVQPVWVEDVADALLLSLYNKDTVEKTYELVGPETFSMVEFLEKLRSKTGLPQATVNLPSVASAYASSIISKAFPGKLFHPDLVELITADSASQRNDLKDNFGINASSLSASLERLAQVYQ